MAVGVACKVGVTVAGKNVVGVANAAMVTVGGCVDVGDVFGVGITGAVASGVAVACSAGAAVVQLVMPMQLHTIIKSILFSALFFMRIPSCSRF